MKFFVTILVACLSSACTAVYQAPGQEATFSLSTTSTNKPALSIEYDCKRHRVTEGMVADKSPGSISELVYGLPTGTPVTFTATYSGVPKKSKQLEQKGAFLYQAVDAIDVGHCRSSITFVPQSDKHYEVFFNIQLDRCAVRAVERAQKLSLDKTAFNRVAQLKKPDC